MKYCTKCGAELADEAVICVKCGRMLEKEAPAAPLQQTELSLGNKTPTALIVFHFLATIMSVLSACFMVLSVAWGYISVTSSLRTDYWGNIVVDNRTAFNPEYDVVTVAFVLACLAFAFGLTAFILSLTKKQGKEKVFSGITKLAVGVILCVCTALGWTSF